MRNLFLSVYLNCRFVKFNPSIILNFIMRQIIILLYLVFIYEISGMSRSQLKKTLTVMKNQCMPKIGVTNEKVADIEKGVFIEDHDVMCYISCVYKTALVVKNNRLDKDLISKQVDILYPKELRAAVKNGVAKCFGIQDKYEDGCEGIFYATKCLYESDPESFVFP